MKYKLSILIVNFNTDLLVVDAVNSVFKYTKNITFEIIIIDNNSPKTTKLDSLLKNYKNVKLFKLDKNLGFGRANNFAFNKSEGEYVFLLNSDAYLIEDIFLKLIEILEKKPDIGCISPNVFLDNNELGISYGNFLTKEKILHDLKIKKIPKKQINGLSIAKKFKFQELKYVDYVTGAALMLRKNDIETYGLFNPDYFMYYEDMELCYMFRSFNLYSAIEPNCKIVHIGGQSYNQIDFSNLKKTRIILHSKYIFSKNILPLYYAKILYLYSILKSIIKYINNKVKSIMYKMISNK